METKLESSKLEMEVESDWKEWLPAVGIAFYLKNDSDRRRSMKGDKRELMRLMFHQEPRGPLDGRPIMAYTWLLYQVASGVAAVYAAAEAVRSFF
ncbi:hypothetical protein KY329_04445 [Candidatus Woesearchaeota archaeon]|nr:hypothetical protein [Candidatus Woesearchaeota archaeon]